MTLFYEIVEKRIDDPRGKLTPLIKYTKGDAKEMIKHCVQQSPAQGFKVVQYHQISAKIQISQKTVFYMHICKI